jgi:hypothetical protein
MPVTRRAFVGSSIAGIAGCHAKRPPPAAQQKLKDVAKALKG